jgi:hypothetical protein
MDVSIGVITAVKISVLVFWVETSCGLESGYQRFGETYYCISKAGVRGVNCFSIHVYID